MLPHCTDQVTPLAVGSFVTAALTGAVASAVTEAGGGCRNAIAGIEVIEIDARPGLPVTVEEAAEATAETTTVPPGGYAAGAVYWIFEILPVVDSPANVPHPPGWVLPQDTLHATVNPDSFGVMLA